MADRLDSTGLSHLWSALKALFGGKAEKVSNATNGNFAGLDANGNLTDSGHKHSDYLTSHQDISGKADKVTGATNGNFASLDANGNLKDSGHKHSDYLTSHQDISGKVSGPSSATNNAVALFNGTGGKTIKDSAKTITDKTASTAMANDANICTNRTILNSYYNGLDKTASGFSLDARQGKTLNDAITGLKTINTGAYTINANFSNNNTSTYKYVGKIGIFSISCSYSGSTQSGWYNMATGLNPASSNATRCVIENITDSKPTLAKIESGTLSVYKPEANKAYGGQIIFLI